MNSLIHFVEETASTNSALAASRDDKAHGFTLAALSQTAGRGQRGNSWEAEPGMNLTFSTLLRPSEVPAAEQFVISEAVSLAIVDTLDALLAPFGKKALIKWPNDIYVDDGKICGILIENTLSGRCIDSSIAGIGINVNQTEFRSDAPNPVSLAQITGQKYSIEDILETFLRNLLTIFPEGAPAIERKELHERYIHRLWRAEGFHPYRTPDGAEFNARICGIDPDGRLHLQPDDGPERCFYFKEVSAMTPRQ